MINLKYDFINENHKLMHNALIAAGWICWNDTITFQCKDTLWEWVYKKGEEAIYFSNIAIDVYHRDINDKKLKFHYTLFAEVADIIEAELKNLRDTNPDEEIKMQEDQECYPITKDNIVGVLEYNRVAKDKYSLNEDYITCIKIIDGQDYGNCISFKNPLWLQLVEVFFGKLKPIPKPKFDFNKYVVENTTDKQWGKIYKLAHAIIDGKSLDIKEDEHNAKIAVQMAKLSEKLK